MNEEKFEKAMQSYADAIGTPQRQPKIATKSVRTRKRAMVLVGAGVVALATAVSLWPQDAVAGTLKRLGLAIQNAQTMEVVASMQDGKGNWKVYGERFYKKGAWRYKNRQKSNLECTIVVRDGMALSDYTKLDHATLEKADAGYFDQEGDAMSAIDFAKRSIDQGQVDIERTTTIEESQPINGRETYKIVFVRKEDEYRAEILVDKELDLPISTTTTLKHDSSPKPLFYREEYQFNQNLPDSLFKLESAKPIVRLKEEQDKLVQKWSKPLAMVKDVEVRDASITADGTVWVVCTFPDGSDIRPTRLETLDGQPYVRTRDIVPSAILSKQNPFTFKGKDVIVVGFLPLDIKQPKPSNVTVVFTRRASSYPGFAREEKPKISADLESVNLTLRKEKGDDRPSYFTALDLDHYGFQLPINNWYARAMALKEAGRTLDAAKAYEQTAVEYRGFVKYVAYQPLQEAAKCYRELGMNDVADQRDAEAKTLKGDRER